MVEGIHRVLGSDCRVPQNRRRKAEMTGLVRKRAYGHKMDLPKGGTTVAMVSNPKNEGGSVC